MDSYHAMVGLPEEHTEILSNDDEPVIMQVAIPLVHPHDQPVLEAPR